MDVRQWLGEQTWPSRSRAGLVAVSLVVMAVISAIDILSPPDVHLGPLLVVAPAFTASFGGPRLTGLIGLLAVLTLVAVGVLRGVLDTENLIVQIISIVVLSALLVVFCQLRERHQGELSRARFVSETTQRVLLPPIPEKAGPLRIASCYRAAEADTAIGGDLYALARTARSTRLIIGDVRGKGLSTLGTTAMLLGAFRAAAHRQAPLPELVSYLEGSVCWGLAQYNDTEGEIAEGDIGERFITAVILDIPDDQPVVHLVNCGHPPPPLGLGALTNTPYDVVTFPLEPEDLLLLYTDGIIEARDHSGVFYPLVDRAPQWAGHDPDAFLNNLWRDVWGYVGQAPEDDIALIALRRAPEPTPPLTPD
jgi:hypothetical protein